jgi:hypothetical protein
MRARTTTAWVMRSDRCRRERLRVRTLDLVLFQAIPAHEALHKLHSPIDAYCALLTTTTFPNRIAGHMHVSDFLSTKPFAGRTCARFACAFVTGIINAIVVLSSLRIRHSTARLDTLGPTSAGLLFGSTASSTLSAKCRDKHRLVTVVFSVLPSKQTPLSRAKHVRPTTDFQFDQPKRKQHNQQLHAQLGERQRLLCKTFTFRCCRFTATSTTGGDSATRNEHHQQQQQHQRRKVS